MNNEIRVATKDYPTSGCGNGVDPRSGDQFSAVGVVSAQDQRPTRACYVVKANNGSNKGSVRIVSGSKSCKSYESGIFIGSSSE